MTLETLAMQGRSKVSTSLAASLSSKILEIRKERIKESFCDFPSAEHRMELVANIHGIEFINDSRACTVNSTWYALESMDKPVIWITGGFNRGVDFSSIVPLVQKKVKTILCIGKDPGKILKPFMDLDIPMALAENMEEAVEMGYFISRKGDAVLLSPGCPSFDQYENFEERGNMFRNAVRNL